MQIFISALTSPSPPKSYSLIPHKLILFPREVEENAIYLYLREYLIKLKERKSSNSTLFWPPAFQEDFHRETRIRGGGGKG
ncbi:MAG: hypothetical protein DRO52_01300 [Candidatus Hecatellales archaeon]|nr:MAG: hypothetical protein DRO52_01300 [Candidatus Hecatellales archaeon]